MQTVPQTIVIHCLYEIELSTRNTMCQYIENITKHYEGNVAVRNSSVDKYWSLVVSKN